MTKTVKIKVNKTLMNFAAGSVVTLPVDHNGVPFAAFWRRRLKDAETDNCCEIVQDQAPPVPKPEKSTKQKQQK